MARINIEEKWWSDPRRSKLSQLLGNQYFTETVVVHCWRLAQEYWEKNLLIPGHIYVTLHGSLELLKSNLCILHENNDPNSAILRTPLEHISNTSEQLQTHWNIIEQSSIYVRGAKEFLSWGAEIRQKRVEAGRKSAEKRRLLNGSAQPKPNKPRTLLEHPSTNSNILELSGSDSGSGSSSNSSSGSKKKNAGIHMVYPPAFDELWKSYERKGDKKLAYEGFKKLNLNETEIIDLGRAIRNYKSKKPDPEFRKDMQNFLNMDWRELLISSNDADIVHPKTQERLNTFENWKSKIENSENGGTNESKN